MKITLTIVNALSLVLFASFSHAQNFTPDQSRKIHSVCGSFQDTETRIRQSCSTAGNIDRCISMQRENLIQNQINQASRAFGEKFNGQALYGLKVTCINSGYKVWLN